ncbi:MAG TPA: outer membrane beta-barrel protein [Parafilimonas sp.]|nr:outer membrane beta-barrel protein [Parafilimonas sp.]
MKKLTLLFSFALFIIAAKAQDDKSTKDFHFAAGIDLALPTGDFNDTHSFGLGVQLQPEYNLSSLFSVYGSIGYTSFFGKKFDGVKIDNVGLIPILAGVRVYPAPQFFAGAKFGLGILTGGGDSESAFDYQPQIGYNADQFQIALGYNGLSKNGATLSNLNLSFLYKF